MGKKTITLISFTAVLLILIGLLYVVSNRPKTLVKEDVVSVSPISLFDISYGDIESLTIEPQDSETFRLNKIEGEWFVEGSRSAYKLKQIEINKTLRSFIELEALSSLGEVTTETLEAYGLDESTIITVDLGSQGLESLYIGEKTIRASYYAMIEGDPSVYEIDLASALALNQPLNDYRIKTLMLPMDALSIEQLLLKRVGKETIEMVAIENAVTSGSRTTASHRLIQPFKESRDVNNNRTEELVASLNTLVEAEAIIEDQPQDLTIYGLDQPELEILIKDEQQEITFLIGKKVGDAENLVYCMLLDGDTIYTIRDEGIAYLASVQAYELIFHFVMLVNIDDMDKVYINKGDQETILKVDRMPEETYSINTKQISEADFKALYQSLIALSTDSLAPETTDISDGLITIDYYNESNEALGGMVTFVPYNEFFYGAYAKGAYRGVIAKEAVNKIFMQIDSLLLE